MTKREFTIVGIILNMLFACMEINKVGCFNLFVAILLSFNLIVMEKFYK